MKFRYLELFWAKIQFCPIFPWKSAFSGRPCLKTSLWHHTLADFQSFGINGKERPTPILWYHTFILWACQSQVHEGVVTTPLGRCVTENTFGRRGLRDHNWVLFSWDSSSRNDDVPLSVLPFVCLTSVCPFVRVTIAYMSITTCTIRKWKWVIGR